MAKIALNGMLVEDHRHMARAVAATTHTIVSQESANRAPWPAPRWALSDGEVIINRTEPT
jgi:hypothetical protein